MSGYEQTKSASGRIGPRFQPAERNAHEDWNWPWQLEHGIRLCQSDVTRVIFLRDNCDIDFDAFVLGRIALAGDHHSEWQYPVAHSCAQSRHLPTSMSQQNVLEGYEDTVFQLTSLITAYPPPFIYVHDPATPHLAASALRSALLDLKGSVDINLRIALVDAVMCFNPRLLYDTVLNALAEWSPTWEDGCNNWEGPSSSQGQRFNESFDAFVHGIQAVQNSIHIKSTSTAVNTSGKARQVESRNAETRIVVLIERAERLKEYMTDLLVPLTRLSELVRHLFEFKQKQCTNLNSREQTLP